MMQKPDRWIVFRPNASPLAPLPLNVRSVGRYAVGPDWREAPKKKWFVQLFWTARGRGEFRLDDRWRASSAGEIFFYHPGDVHEIRARAPWVYYWVTLDHVDSGRWLEGFGLGERAYRAGPCPEALFGRMAKALSDCTADGERKAAHLAHALLVEASSVTSEPDTASVAARARKFLDRRFQDPASGVGDVAGELGVHRSTLFRLFVSHYGLTPSQYLQNLRIQKALSLLPKTSIQIQEVAWQSGFSDPSHL